MEVVVKRYEVYLINLDPTIGNEIKKTRPCLIISSDELNSNLNTVIAAPMTTVKRGFPTRINCKFKNKSGQIVLDQMRTVDKKRLIKKLGEMDETVNDQVTELLLKIFSK